MEQLETIKSTLLKDILEKVINEVEDWIIISDQLGKIVYVNSVVLKTCHLDQSNVLGRDICLFLGVDLTDNDTLQQIQKSMQQEKKFEFITSCFIKDNKRIYLVNQLRTLWMEEGLTYYVCISKDITNTRKSQDEYYKTAYFDVLTHYPNHKVFIESLNKQIHRAQSKKSKCAVILVDIGRLEEINNLYGMSKGDYLIKEIGKRIKKELSVKQEIFKGKGSSFAIIEQDVEDGAQISSFLRKINQIIEEPVQIHNRYIYVELKSGIALYPDHSLKGVELIKMAQVALIHAKKQRGVVPYIFYSRAIHEEVKNNLQLETELQLAVEKDQLIIHYQPFVDLKEGKLAGMEALVRIKKENGELIPPGVFIKKFEKMHLIEKVGIRILEKVCLQLRQWMDKGYKIVPISVNLSAVQFKNINLAREIKAILKKYNISPRYIVLEITETAVMEDVGIAQLIIEELKAYGFSISIDDFGTGYASIGYLKKLMFDHLKIDISFIREIVENPEDRTIVEAIIAIAKTLNLKTIAEGIESKEQLGIMNELGCEMGQGYLWDRPISALQIEKKYFNVYL